MQDSVTGDGRTRFRPTWPQAVGRGLLTGLLGAAAALALAGLVAAVGAVLGRHGGPPRAGWLALAAGPPVLGLLLGVLHARRCGTDVDSGGIRPVSGARGRRQSWGEVVELRAERRRRRTVVAVYLDSGAMVQLRAPYHGGLLGADPQFERKLFALAVLWRSHRIGRPPVGDPPGPGVDLARAGSLDSRRYKTGYQLQNG